jgi:hypothetical protein
MEHVRKCDWYITHRGVKHQDQKAKLWVTITSLVTYSCFGDCVDPDRFNHITLYGRLSEGD